MDSSNNSSGLLEVGSSSGLLDEVVGSSTPSGHRASRRVGNTSAVNIVRSLSEPPTNPEGATNRSFNIKYDEIDAAVIAATKSAREDQEKRVLKLEEKLEKSRNDSKEKSTKIANLTKENKKGKEEQDALRSQIRNLQGKVGKLEGKLEDDKKTIEDLEHQLEEKEEKVLKNIHGFLKGVGQMGKLLMDDVKNM